MYYYLHVLLLTCIISYMYYCLHVLLYFLIIFSITGPRTPVLKMLEEVAAPKDCTRLDILPDMSFTLMGTEFSLTRNEYVVYAGKNFTFILNTIYVLNMPVSCIVKY